MHVSRRAGTQENEHLKKAKPLHTHHRRKASVSRLIMCDSVAFFFFKCCESAGSVVTNPRMDSRKSVA